MKSIRRASLTILQNNIEIEKALPTTRVVSMWFVVTLGRYLVRSKLLKLIYRNSESVPKFEVRMRLDLYRMSKNEVYPSSITYYLTE